jgi:hypothetical protein
MLPVRLLPLLAAACTASAVDVAPPKYEPYFPTGMAISADERWLFVLSANSDLRYSSGSVQVLDLDRVDEIAGGWTASRDARADLECAPLPGRPLVLGCPLTLSDGGPSPAIVPGGSVLVGNFGVSLDTQQLVDSGGAPSSIVRVFATVRGDPSVTWMDFDTATGTTSCGGSGDFPRCAETHRLARLRNDATLPGLPQEPFTLHVAGEHVYVTHFTTGFLSLFSAPRTVGSQPMLQDTARNLWAQNNVTGATGSAGVAARPGDPSGLVYVTSRQEARVSMVTTSAAEPGEDGLPREAVVRTGWFFLSGVERAGFQGDNRDLRFSPDGSRAWVLSRLPASLQLFDTSLDERGAPRNQHLRTVEVCEQPANLAVADLGGGPVAAVPCFTNGQVWFIDGRTLDLIAIEQSGRGPSGVVAARTRNKVYVGNYAEDTISVIDVAPGSRHLHRTVLRLGTPRPVEERQ